MRGPNPTVALLCICVVGTGAGCSGRAVGVVEDGGGHLDGEPGPGDGGVDAGAPDGRAPDAGAPDAGAVLWGRIELTHFANLPDSALGQAYDELELRAAFWTEPYTPPEVMPDPFMQTRVTPDGVECDAYFCSGMDPGCPPGLPPGPVQADGGRIRTGAWDGDGPMMEVAFDGQRYTVDFRSELEPNHPLPGWFSTDPFTIHVIGDGSPNVESFVEPLDMSAVPVIVSPAGTNLVPGPDGHILIAWQRPPNTETVVRLHLFTGSEHGIFFCRPAQNVTSLRLPTEWLDWPFAQGDLRVESRLYSEFYVPQASVVLRSCRVRRLEVFYNPAD